MVVMHSFMKQLTSSIAILRSLKNKNPEIITAVYGYDFSYPAGKEILKLTDVIDYILDGDPENTIIEFYDKAVNKRCVMPGLIKCDPVMDLDILPYPDYSDYFRELDELWFKYVRRTVCIEGSRGCNWGETRGCLFCGHGYKNSYRTKSPDRFIGELESLVKLYEAEQVQTEDYIMPATYPQTVFGNMKPMAVKNIFYEVNPNTSISDLQIMRGAGVNIIQPGIENLNDDILKILNKSTDTVSNIRLLRDCKIAGIKPLWNLIYGVPGEKEDDYADMLENIIPAILHLEPPASTRPIYIQKNSPLLDSQNMLDNIKPYEVYEHIFPDGTDIDKVAMFFTADYKTAFSNLTLKKDFFLSMNSWKKIWKDRMPSLILLYAHGKYAALDTRSSPEGVKLDMNERHMILLQKSFLPAGSDIFEEFAASNGLLPALKELMENKIILKINGEYISLLEHRFTEK
jgi:ribosomal peptide maturation radical SAM protein 1